MSLEGVPPIKVEGLTIQARPHGATAAVLELAGTLALRDPTPLLAPFFERLHAVMIATERRQLTVDMRELRFMNSSSFKSFVRWIKINDALPADRRYAIHFLLSATHHWQEVSIHAMRCFSMEAISVEKARPEAGR